MDYKYSCQNFKEETMARALGRGLPISIKHSTELAKQIKNMMVPRAKRYLEEVMALKQPVRFGRFNRDLGHKKKIGPGRYPIKTAEYFLKILKLAESNAQFKGLSITDLKIIHIVPQEADSRWHYGRQKRRQFKSSHLEIVIEEVNKKQKVEEKKAIKKPETKPIIKEALKKDAPKIEVKPEIKKSENKPDSKIEEKPAETASKKETPKVKETQKPAEPSQSPEEEPKK